MRHAQSRFVDDFPSVKDQIHVERARRTLVRTLAAVRLLDRQQAFQKRTGSERRLTDDGAVEKIRLQWDTDRRGLMPRRHAQAGKDAVQMLNRGCQVRGAIAQVAAKGNRRAIQSSAW